VAYSFVDAILVTPFGALSVVITTVLSAIFLKERLSFVGKVGCFQCVIGAVVIALNAPEQSSVANIQQMQHYVIAPGFLTYTGIVILGCAFTAFWVAPRYGNKSMFVYLTICSLIGGLSVVATQGLGAAIVAAIGHTAEVNQFKQWFFWVLFVFVVCTLLTEIIYLNVSDFGPWDIRHADLFPQKALNIYNAALVTPTYYVYFTSATIITSAILFRGFKGSTVGIVSVVMGFLTICSGVVLLQLAKSSKDVPDTAVFKGDLDQVRTIAEQEEPESEPRADTIRGGAAIVRALSRKRTMRQLQEAQAIANEHMEPIDENDDVYFDGLRRRKTTSAGTTQRSIRSVKTSHPPLGLTHFPDPNHHSESSDDDDVHPGFLPRFRRSRKNSRQPSNELPLKEMKPADATSSTQPEHEHVFGLPPGIQSHGDHDMDTSYKGGSAIQWTTSIDERERGRANSQTSSLMPPKPPPHARPDSSGKRTFSFQNVFHRNTTNSRLGDGPITNDDSTRPLSRGALSFVSRKSNSSHQRPNSRHKNASEEERLGLVTGDAALTRSSSPTKSTPTTTTATSSKDKSPQSYTGLLPAYEAQHEDDDDDDDWFVTSGRGSESPEDVSHGFSGGGDGGGDLGRVRMDQHRIRSDESNYLRYDSDDSEYMKPKKPSGL
jgi:drug/metabolite transporter (DMT)-like permease